MISKLNQRFAESPRVLRSLSVVLLVCFLGLLDHFTGYEYSFSIFYLLPVTVAAWHLGQGAVRAAASLSAATWLVVDFTSGHTYSSAVIPWWNAAVRLGFFLITGSLVAELRRRLEFERVLARVDPLTGALNQRAFDEESARVLALAQREGRPVSLAYLDLDRFKSVNDSRGHAEGDRLLRLVVDTIRGSVRTYDLVARLGGDEFAILVPFAGAPEARSLAEKIRARVAAVAGKNGWGVTASVGVVTFPDPPSSLAEAIRAADDLMYRAKDGGRDAVVAEVFPAAERQP